MTFFVDEPSFKHGRGGRRTSKSEHEDLKPASDGKLSDAVSTTMATPEASKVDEMSQRKLSANQKLSKLSQIRQRSENQTPLGPSKTTGGLAVTPSTKITTQQGLHEEHQPQKQQGLGDASSDEAGDRFSLSFLNSLIHSGSDHHQQFAVTPPFGGGEYGYGAHSANNFGEQYRQDYVMVEAGCRVVIDLPHVRRGSKGEKGGETPPAGEFKRQFNESRTARRE